MSAAVHSGEPSTKRRRTKLSTRSRHSTIISETLGEYTDPVPCPVCSKLIFGDVNMHVDNCLKQQQMQKVPNCTKVDEQDLDVDNDDNGLYGAPQFTEADLVGLNYSEDEAILRERVASGISSTVSPPCVTPSVIRHEIDLPESRAPAPADSCVTSATTAVNHNTTNAMDAGGDHIIHALKARILELV